jgi:hypothetical protein
MISILKDMPIDGVKIVPYRVNRAKGLELIGAIEAE